MLYTHYYGVFIFASQMVIALFFLSQSEDKKRYFIFFLISGIIVGFIFILWFVGPFYHTASSIQSFWIKKQSLLSIFRFFPKYFSTHSLFLEITVTFVLLISLAHLLLNAYKKEGLFKKGKLNFLIISCFVWVFITLLIPYIYSLVKLPVLHIRYTIVLLPAVIIVISVAVELIQNVKIKCAVFISLVIIFVSPLFQNRYYSEPAKTQYREMAQYISSDTAHNTWPIITISMFFPFTQEQSYYLHKNGCNVNIVEGTKKNCDSMLRGKDIKGFWLTRAHENSRWNPVMPDNLDSFYLLLKERSFVDADAKLYIRKRSQN